MENPSIRRVETCQLGMVHNVVMAILTCSHDKFVDPVLPWDALGDWGLHSVSLHIY